MSGPQAIPATSTNSGARDIAVVKRTIMLLGAMIARKRISEDGTGRIIGAIAVGNRPLHDHADTLTDPPGGRGNDEPDGGENIHEIRGRERGDGNTAKAREHVLLQQSDPDGGLARMRPLGATTSGRDANFFTYPGKFIA